MPPPGGSGARATCEGEGVRGRSTGPLCSASRQPAVRARGAVVHLIMLVWKHSKHYNTPARLVVLMREICNDLIDQVCNRRVTGV